MNQDDSPSDVQEAVSAERPAVNGLGLLQVHEHHDTGKPLTTSPSQAADAMNNLHIDTVAPNTATSLGVKDLPSTPPPPQPPAANEKPYRDPTPKTPVPSRVPSTRAPAEEYNEKNMDNELEPTQDSRQPTENDNESASEIQSIMDQFDDASIAPTKEEIMSPRNEVSSPLQSPGQYPPRKSSLEHIRSRDMDAFASSPVATTSDPEKLPLSPPPVPPKYDSANLQSSSLQASKPSLPHQPPPPEPDPDAPFDFHRFLEQLRHKSADPVAKFLRSFLTEFGKKHWMVHEQIKIIGDFLAFITNKMALCEVWRDVSENEFENAREGMEKLVMNRLYSQTFSPAIAPPPQLPRSRSRSRKREPDKTNGPGRRGQHQEDVERDDILAQKIRIYSWVREEHLDIAPVGPNGERFLRLAQQELLKIKSYRAPRDKVICVLNACKVIFGLLKNAKTSDTSADSFVPLLIYVVLQANPENLISNIQYILRFRNQDKLGGEAGYYLSSLSGAVQFIEGLDRTTLTISDEDFERNVEAAVSEIAAQNREAEALSPRTTFREKSTVAEPELTPRNSLDVTATPRRPMRESGSGGVSSSSEENDAVAGLLRTIQRPLSTIGRIFSDDTSPDQSSVQQGTSRLSPLLFNTPKLGAPDRTSSQTPVLAQHQRPPERQGQYDAQEAAARQASAEAAEARRIQRAEHKTVVETLCGMFPNLDKEVIDDVVRQKQGRVGLAVDACLALTAGG